MQTKPNAQKIEMKWKTKYSSFRTEKKNIVNKREREGECGTQQINVLWQYVRKAKIDLRVIFRLVEFGAYKSG